MTKTIKRKGILRYCFGEFSRAIFNGLTVTYLMYIYIPSENSSIPVLLTNAALAFAVIRGIGAIVDAFIDLWIANYSDRLNSRLGRRIPLMRVAVFPWAISCALMAFVPMSEPHWINTVWLGIVMTLYFIFSSLYAVPYNALASEIVSDTEGRVKFFTLNTFFFVLGSAFIYVTPLIKGQLLSAGMSELQAWRLTFVCFSLMALVFAAIPAFFFDEKKHVNSKPSYVPLIESFKATFKYRNYTILSLGFLLMWVAFAFFNASLMYYITMLIGEAESFSTVVMGIAMIVGVLSYPLVNYGAQKFGKKKLLVGACIAYIIIYFAIYNYEAVVGVLGGSLFSVLIGICIGFPISITNIIPSAAFADLTQVDEIKTGVNRAGMFVAAKSFIQQLSQSLVVIVIPTVISLQSTTQKATVYGVRMTALIATCAIICACVVYLFYDDKQTTRIIDDYNKKIKADEASS